MVNQLNSSVKLTGHKNVVDFKFLSRTLKQAYRHNQIKSNPSAEE